MKSVLPLIIILTLSAPADEITLRVTGLFSKDRATDLHAAVEKIDRVKIRSIDFETANVTFTFDVGDEPFKPDATPDQIRQAIDSKVKAASRHTFAAIPPSALPKEKLEKIEIPVAGIDCKGCSYAAYRAIYQLDGVQRATASFKTGQVTALVDPAVTNRATLEEALTNRRVTITPQQ